MTLVEFVRSKVHCSYEEAYQFIVDFKHHSDVQGGRNIVENHIDNFNEDFDTDNITDEDYAKIAIEVDEEVYSDIGSKEDEVLSRLYGENYC